MFRKSTREQSQSKVISSIGLSLFGLPFFAAALETDRGDSTTYQATASYIYRFGEKEYRDKWVSFQPGSDKRMLATFNATPIASSPDT